MTNCDPFWSLVPIAQQWAARHSAITRVCFFGSQVKGTAGPASDLDVAVALHFLESGTSLAYWMAHQDTWARELTEALKVQVDLQWDGGTETPTISAGLDDACLVVYERRQEGCKEPRR